MFYLELVSGLRKDDLVALRWTDLKAERRIMPVSKQVTARNSKVTLSRPNTETSVREVFIPQTVVELLTQEHENHRDNILLLHQKKA